MQRGASCPLLSGGATLSAPASQILSLPLPAPAAPPCSRFVNSVLLDTSLIEHALILPVATTTVERAFSAMNLIKIELRKK